MCRLAGSREYCSWADRKMAHQINESDWKVFRQLRAIALERLCERVIDEIRGKASVSDLTAHDRYLDVVGLIKRRDREMANAFDDVRRSTAFIRMLAIVSLGLLTEDEIDQFSPEMRDGLRSLRA